MAAGLGVTISDGLRLFLENIDKDFFSHLFRRLSY